MTWLVPLPVTIPLLGAALTLLMNGRPRVQRTVSLTALTVTLLVSSALLYLWGLGSSGWANAFYSAAVQAGSESWKAMFFGSFDASNAITVDKPPAALWVMALSGRIFGFSSWSMLAPQALMGVASVWLLYAAVRRWSGPAAGLAAAALLAVTPVAVLMFRFNNPDALLVLLMIAAAYCVVRAVDAAATRWMDGPGGLARDEFADQLTQWVWSVFETAFRASGVHIEPDAPLTFALPTGGSS